jgi:hypothetical protein
MGDLPELRRRWSSGEERLYPVVMVRPDLYEPALRLARAVADRLWTCVTEESLAATYGESGDLAAQVAADEGIPTRELDLPLVTDAAFNLRRREILAGGRRAERARRIGEARERGERWIVLEEMGGMPPVPLSRLEMSLAGVAAIHSTIDEDPASGGPRYQVESLWLDPDTGDPAPDASPPVGRAVYSSHDAWRQALAALRQALESLPPPGGR